MGCNDQDYWQLSLTVANVRTVISLEFYGEPSDKLINNELHGGPLENQLS